MLYTVTWSPFWMGYRIEKSIALVYWLQIINKLSLSRNNSEQSSVYQNKEI